ncbi:hypothetical protein OIU79_025290, partial [Salix purpurea]
MNNVIQSAFIYKKRKGKGKTKLPPCRMGFFSTKCLNYRFQKFNVTVPLRNFFLLCTQLLHVQFKYL